MQKLAAVTALVIGLVILPGVVSASPLGINGCTTDATGANNCDIFVDDVTGHSILDMSASNPSWLVGYTFLLNVGADLSDGIQESDVADALVIHNGEIDLYTPIVGSTLFSSIVADALALTPIDGTALSDGQIVGAPISSGTAQLNGVGLFNTAETVEMLSQIAWGSSGSVGGYDSLTVHTGVSPIDESPAPVPEPGTLSLFAIGGLVGAVRRYRAKKAA
jgi:hypothetical protein